MRLPWLHPHDSFPPVTAALREPNGLLAAGADLSPARLLDAYTHGIFPWYSEGEPILWWSPSPRCVIYPAQFHASRSLQKSWRRHAWRISPNTAFADVMLACATSGERAQRGTWITGAMVDAYCTMHELGWAHSLEVWRDDALVGGIYGLAIGEVFFGESMFSRVTDASKIALWWLCRSLHALGFALLDCQVENPHLLSLGAQCIPRGAFQHLLQQHAHAATPLAVPEWRHVINTLTA
jgi:leucyl/phenylalanyl-tRNA--protein transferase